MGKFCRHCGSGLADEGGFCDSCGAPRGDSDGAENPPVAESDLNQSAAGPRRRRVSASTAVIIASVALIVASGLFLGAYELFIKPAHSQGVATVQTTGSASADTVDQTSAPTTPPSTESSSVEVDFSTLIRDKNMAGITEQQANEMFGVPMEREINDFPDGTECVYLKYDSFTLTYGLENGNTTDCYQVDITKVPSRVRIYGLSLGMGLEDVQAVMDATSFTLVNEESDESYLLYTDDLSGREIDVDFDAGAVTDLFVLYWSPTDENAGGGAG